VSRDHVILHFTPEPVSLWVHVCMGASAGRPCRKMNSLGGVLYVSLISSAIIMRRWCRANNQYTMRYLTKSGFLATYPLTCHVQSNVSKRVKIHHIPAYLADFFDPQSCCPEPDNVFSNGRLARAQFDHHEVAVQHQKD